MANPTFTSLTPGHGSASGGTSFAVVGTELDVPGELLLLIDVGGVEQGVEMTSTGATGATGTMAAPAGGLVSGVAYGCAIQNSDGNSNTLAGSWTWDSGPPHRLRVFCIS